MFQQSKHIQYILTCIHVCTHVCVLKSKDSLWESVLSFPHLDHDGQTQVIGLCDKHLYPLGYLTSPQ